MASKRPTSSSRAGNEGTYGPKKKRLSPEQKMLNAILSFVPSNPLDFSNTKKLQGKRKSGGGKAIPRKATRSDARKFYALPKKRNGKPATSASAVYKKSARRAFKKA